MSLATARQMVKQHRLGGIHVWRLNDGEQQKMLAENSLMRQVSRHHSNHSKHGEHSEGSIQRGSGVWASKNRMNRIS
eukprot:symbB.v1.2.006265.t2/scaffold368.1/size218619/8